MPARTQRIPVNSLLFCRRFWEILEKKKKSFSILALLHICGSFSVTYESIRNKQPSKCLFLPPFKPTSRVWGYWTWRTCSCSAAQLHRSTEHYWASSASSKNVAASLRSGFHTFKRPPPFLPNYSQFQLLAWTSAACEYFVLVGEALGNLINDAAEM